MSDGTTGRYSVGEARSGVQRRKRWTPEEKARIVEETYLPGMSVSLVARRHGIGGNQIFTWQRLMASGALTAAAAGEEVVPATEYRAAGQVTIFRLSVPSRVSQAAFVIAVAPSAAIAGVFVIPRADKVNGISLHDDLQYALKPDPSSS